LVLSRLRNLERKKERLKARKIRLNFYGNIVMHHLLNFLIEIYCASKKDKNFSIDTEFIEIGIELCKIPHISEHCP